MKQIKSKREIPEVFRQFVGAKVRLQIKISAVATSRQKNCQPIDDDLTVQAIRETVRRHYPNHLLTFRAPACRNTIKFNKKPVIHVLTDPDDAELHAENHIGTFQRSFTIRSFHI